MAYMDTTSGTPVTLVVTPGQTSAPPPPPPIPFTGFSLLPALLLATVLLALGTVVLTLLRRPVPVRVRRTPSPR
jgi:hypothetical protein